MPKFVIEREVPGAGNLTDAELQAISQKSVDVIKGNGPGDSMAAELRNGRQDLLRVSGSRRKCNTRACKAGRLSRESHIGREKAD